MSSVLLISIATASLQAQGDRSQAQIDTAALIEYVRSLHDSLPERVVIHYIYPFDCVNCLATMKNRLYEEKKERDDGRLQGIILFPANSSERRIKAVLKYMEVNPNDPWLVIRDDHLKQMVEALRPPGIKVSHSVLLDLDKKRVIRSY